MVVRRSAKAVFLSFAVLGFLASGVGPAFAGTVTESEFNAWARAYVSPPAKATVSTFNYSYGSRKGHAREIFNVDGTSEFSLTEQSGSERTSIVMRCMDQSMKNCYGKVSHNGEHTEWAELSNEQANAMGMLALAIPNMGDGLSIHHADSYRITGSKALVRKSSKVTGSHPDKSTTVAEVTMSKNKMMIREKGFTGRTSYTMTVQVLYHGEPVPLPNPLP